MDLKFKVDNYCMRTDHSLKVQYLGAKVQRGYEARLNVTFRIYRYRCATGVTAMAGDVQLYLLVSLGIWDR